MCKFAQCSQKADTIDSIFSMSNSFTFRQFAIEHDRCAMKVGTDGVLLGAWSDLSDNSQILDVGCGSGLIALMAAQRVPQSKIWGIDVDAPSVEQALQNVSASPFSDRVTLLLEDVRTYSPPFSFDHILCNPPFYTEHTLPPNDARMRARHTAGLSLECLEENARRLMAPSGRFSLVLPFSTAERFISHAMANGWYADRTCKVFTVAHKPPKRMLLTLVRTMPSETRNETLVLQDKTGKRTAEYASLCAEFYLEK